MSAVDTLAGPLNWASSILPAPANEPAPYGYKRWNSDGSFFNGGLPTPPASKAMPGLVLDNSYAAYPVSSYQHDGSRILDSTSVPQQQNTTSMIDQSNPYALAPQNPSSNLYSRRRNESVQADVIAPHLQIPESVNKSKGSLAEFAAELTCLFWFETSKTLQYAENLPEDAPVERGLLPDAHPTIGFRKWVTTIISTTQVGKNVVLLALMFIYRLKKFNPVVSGKRGSEFRLLTIALMLGNKFLDDNTYTNKTWAEVSGISVNEIHIMEVEFLSNMRYDLYASADEWKQWKSKLGRLGAFYHKAARLPFADENRHNGPSPVTPTTQSFPHKLPSPPSTHHSVSPYASTRPLGAHYPVLPYPSASLPAVPSSPLRQQLDLKGYRQERKRSADFAADLPPAKRPFITGQPTGPSNMLPNSLSYPASLRSSPTRSLAGGDLASSTRSLDVPRLDIPRLAASIPLSNTLPMPLPVASNRAVAGVYPAATSAYSQPVTPISAVPQNLLQTATLGMGDGHRAISNLPSSNHTSPSNGYDNVTPTLPGLSPSYFLTHRTSPYRPVRHVNTLLIPPPPAALQVPVRNVPYDQIHYQPLSKAGTERRTGPLPFFQTEGWQQSNASTPIAHPQYQF
jgi:hypothetical protein